MHDLLRYNSSVALTVLSSAPPALDPAALPAARVEALYVHVPFCFHKCHYCDFYSITRQTPARMEHFVDLVLSEARRWTAAGQIEIRPETVFFGGGTPTLLPLESMSRLLDGLRRVFDLSAVTEWTVEANPATVSAEYCDRLRAAGVNRLSFGAQSFDPRELSVLERHHDPADVSRSLELARAAGFSRLNLDLIFAIPGQTLESWRESLERALELGTPHLSCYGLTYEPNTPIAVRRRLGQIVSAEESLELEMLRHTRRRLADAGMPAYEVSNYARAGEECRHNLVYWTGGNYIGLGPSAASHIEGWRWRNCPHLGEWERAINGSGLSLEDSKKTADGASASSSPHVRLPSAQDRPPPALNPLRLPAIEVETLSPARRAGELAMLLLRLSRGIDFADFAGRSGFDARALWADPIARYTAAGLLWQTSHGFGLTERGLVVADALAGEFLDPVIP